MKFLKFTITILSVNLYAGISNLYYFPKAEKFLVTPQLEIRSSSRDFGTAGETDIGGFVLSGRADWGYNKDHSFGGRLAYSSTEEDQGIVSTDYAGFEDLEFYWRWRFSRDRQAQMELEVLFSPSLKDSDQDNSGDFNALRGSHQIGATYKYFTRFKGFQLLFDGTLNIFGEQTTKFSGAGQQEIEGRMDLLFGVEGRKFFEKKFFTKGRFDLDFLGSLEDANSSSEREFDPFLRFTGGAGYHLNPTTFIFGDLQYRLGSGSERSIDIDFSELNLIGGATFLF